MILRASFPNPMDNNEHDFLDTNDIPTIRILDSVLNGNNETYIITFTLKYSEEKNAVLLIGEYDKKKYEAEINPQDFTDEMSRCIINQVFTSSSDLINKTKDIIIDKVSKDLALQGIILEDVSYDAFGYFISDGDNIGTFEKVKLLKDNKFELEYINSVFDLTNLKNLSINFILNGKKYSANIDIVGKVAKADTIKVEDTDEVYDVKPREMFTSTEDLFADRQKLVSASFINSNISIDEFSDLF